MRWLVSVLLLALLITLGVVAVPARAQAAASSGVLRITLVTPPGVPANALVTRGRSTPRVAAKAPAGRLATRVLRLRAGTYRLGVPVVLSRGARYSGPPARTTVVRAGRTTSITVRLRADGGASALRTASLTTTRVTLRWHQQADSVVVLRRAAGLTPPASRRGGTGVRVQKGTATDSRIRPGTTYSYSLFSHVGSRWQGPLTVRLQTPDANGARTNTYVAAPDTVFASQSEVKAAAASGSGVAVALAAGTTRPAIGAPLVLPAGGALPGGYIGRVTGFDDTGRVVLERAGLGDALQQYHLVSTGFTSGAEVLPLARVSTLLRQRNGLKHAVTRAATRRMRPSSAVFPTQSGPMSCDGSASPDATLGSTLGFGGEFDLQGDMAARTAHLRTTVVVEGDIALSLTLAAKAKCSLHLPALEATVMAGPVPIGFVLTPVVEGEVAGAVHVRSAGLRVQAGVSIDQTLDFSRGVPTIRGTQSPIASLTTTSPAVTGRGEITVRVGADVFAGPGAATKLGGVMVGLDGQVDLLRGTFGFAGSTSPDGPSRCTRAEFGFRWALGIGARAWFDFGIVSLSLSKEFTLAELKAAYGPPVMLPAGCTLDEVAPMPGDPEVTGQIGIGTPSPGAPSTDATPAPSSTSTPNPAASPTPTPTPTAARLPSDAADRAGTWQTLSGHLTADQTIGSVDHSGYLVDGLIIDPGVTLTVEPGTRLRLIDRDGTNGALPSLTVGGTVAVAGSVADPVLIGGRNETSIGGTTGQETSSTSWLVPFQVDGSGTLRLSHAVLGATLGRIAGWSTGSGAYVVDSSDFIAGWRIAGQGSVTLQHLHASALDVTAVDMQVTDSALIDTSLESIGTAMSDLALTGASSFRQDGPNVHLTRVTIATESLPISAGMQALAGDFSGATTPGGSPWIMADGGGIHSSITWTDAMPIVFGGPVSIDAGVTVTAPAGSVLKFPSIRDGYGATPPTLRVSGDFLTPAPSSPSGKQTVITGSGDTSVAPVVPPSWIAGPDWGGILVNQGGQADLIDVDVHGSVTIGT